jgi:hypothetical protein
MKDSLAEALARLQRLGDQFNQGNPKLLPSVGKDHRNALRSQLGFWKAIGADSTVLSWIYYGFPHRQFKPAPRGTYKNAPSAHKHAEFMDTFIADQLENGRVKEVTLDFPELVMSLMVQEQLKSNGKLKIRPCVSMVPSNATLATMQFTLETTRRHGRDVIAANDALAVIDLTDAYFHGYMEDSAAPYLCVFWGGKYYAFLCLMFGHALGPFYFTKLTRPILAFFRTLLLKVLGYLGTFSFVPVLISRHTPFAHLYTPLTSTPLTIRRLSTRAGPARRKGSCRFHGDNQAAPRFRRKPQV